MVQIIVQSNLLVRYEVNLNYLVTSLKSLIEENEGIKIDNQRLTYGTKELHDDRTLASYHISENSIVKILATVYLKTITGKTCTFSISPDALVSDLKRLVVKTEGLPFDQQRIVFSGKQLENDLPLYHYKVLHECTLYLIQRLRGGGGARGQHLGRAYALVKHDWAGEISVGSDPHSTLPGLSVQRGDIVVITGKIDERLYRARLPDDREVKFIPCDYVKIILYLDNRFRRFDHDSM